jgi:hypothetical protein
LSNVVISLHSSFPPMASLGRKPKPCWKEAISWRRVGETLLGRVRLCVSEYCCCGCFYLCLRFSVCYRSRGQRSSSVGEDKKSRIRSLRSPPNPQTAYGLTLSRLICYIASCFCNFPLHQTISFISITITLWFSSGYYLDSVLTYMTLNYLVLLRGCQTYSSS